MVVMIVADENKIDRREFIEFNSRFTYARGPTKRNGAASSRINGVDQNIESVPLYQKAGVQNKSDERLMARRAIKNLRLN